MLCSRRWEWIEQTLVSARIGAGSKFIQLLHPELAANHCAIQQKAAVRNRALLD